jgi:NADH-quinone oxidoreductase subunit N
VVEINTLLSYEFPILVGFLWLSYVLLITSTNLFIIYLAFEIQTFIILILVGQLKDLIIPVITNLKYFLFSFLSSLLLLLGLLYIFASTGTLNYYELYIISKYLTSNNSFFILFKLGNIFLLLSFLFKLGNFPFYIWLLDIFEGFPTFIIILLLTLNKFTLYIFLLKYFSIISVNNSILVSLSLSLSLIGCISLLYGSLLAINQTDFHRFFGATSIAHLGILLLLLKSYLLFTHKNTLIIILSYLKSERTKLIANSRK